MVDANEFAYVDFKTLEDYMYDVFVGMGMTPEDSKVVAEVLIESDKRGIDSHGIARCKMYYDRLKKGQISPVTKMTVERETPGTAVINAHNSMGHPISKKAMQMAIDKAKDVGIGMVVVGHSNHFGIAGYYPLMAVEQGMIGMCGTNARPSIAPTWGTEPLLGTNPFTIGMPTDWDFPWVADQATSITQRGKIETYDRLKKPLTPGWVIGADGQTKTDATQTLVDLTKDTAALTPLGGIGEDLAGYKGYNYATFVEILSSCLQHSSFLKACLGVKNGKAVPFDLGHFFIAVNIEAFCSLDEFKKATGDLLRELANSRKQPGADHIYVAGEKEHLAFLKRSKEGVPISKVTQKEMLQMQAELKLDKYKFSFKV
jgi:LDH2 family malate/lactate/ureidoglycolate dehydrogenase